MRISAAGITSLPGTWAAAAAFARATTRRRLAPVAATAAATTPLTSRRPPSSDIDVDESEAYDGANVLSDVENPENLLHGDEVAAVVRQAISDLPEDLRTAVTLREFDGLSYEAIADVMDCPVGTVRSRIFRAREAIDKRLSTVLDRG